MVEVNPGLSATKPIPLLKKSLKFDFKLLFKSISKGITHAATGKWEEIGNDTTETLAAFGLQTDPGELRTANLPLSLSSVR